MHAQLLEDLLHENECSYLDFKRDQYPFASATDYQKAEMLKDILAFANQDSKEVGYIIIGAEENRGGRAIIHGVTEHLAEHSVQQFVNAKTNCPVFFRYHVIPCDGHSIGVLEIRSQPFVFLKAHFKPLLKNICYIRRGSSTAEMNPDELVERAERRAAMKNVPKLTFGPAEIKQSYVIYGPDTDRKLASEIVLEAYALEIPRHPYPGVPDLPRLAAGHDFLPKFGDFLKSAHFFRPIGLFIENGPLVPGVDLHCHISAPLRDDYLIYSQRHYPPCPTWPRDRIGSGEMVVLSDGEIQLRNDHTSTHLEWRVPKVLPGQTVFSKGTVFLVPKRSCEISFQYSIFGENLPTPLQGTFALKLTLHAKAMSVDEFMLLANEFKKRRGFL